MNLNDFYILVDIENKIITNQIQILPENWANISGLSNYGDEKLSNLSWAGHKSLGWINIKSNLIEKFLSSPENLELNKNEFKRLISNRRKEMQSIPIEYKGAKISTDFKTRCSLLFLCNSSKNEINFKCINGYHIFNKLEINEICGMIEQQIQKYFDIEKNIFHQIDKCTSIKDFFNVNYDF
jgi:hypothetical protein